MRSSVDIYPVNTEGKMRPFQCAAINEISMHMDLETTTKKSGLICKQGSLLVSNPVRVQRSFSGQISGLTLSMIALQNKDMKYEMSQKPQLRPL